MMKAPFFYGVLLLVAAGDRSASLDELVRTGVLRADQAAQILQEAAEAAPADYSILGLVSGSTLLTLLGSVLLIFAFLRFAPLETHQGNLARILYGGGFGVVFYGAGAALVSQGSGFLASILLIMSYFAWMLCVWSVFAALGLASLPDTWQGKLEVSALQLGASLVLSYSIARSCTFVLAQLPFFLSFYQATVQIGRSKLLSEQRQPTTQFAVIASTGVFLLFYTHWTGPSAFLAHVDLLSDASDFQGMAYGTGAVMFWEGFSELVKTHSALEWAKVPVAVGMLLFGFRIPCTAVIFFSMKWLADELAAISMSASLFPGVLYVPPLLCVFLISNHSLQLVNDIFAPQVRIYLANSYLWSLICYVLTVVTSFSALLFSLGISNVTVEEVSGDEREETVTILWGRVTYKFFLCYTLTLLLVLLAEYESSWLISLAYLVFAVISYWKVLGLLLVSDPSEAVLGMLFFSGQRISVVGSGFWTCFLLGAVLMGASLIFLSFRAKDSRSAYGLSLFLLGCVFYTALVVQSSLLFAASVMLSLQVVSARLKGGQMAGVMGAFALVTILYLAEVWSFAGIAGNFARTSTFKRVISAMSDPSALAPEKEVARKVFLSVREWLLELSVGA